MSENVVEETIKEGTTEAIMLSASFQTGYDSSYEYNVKDLSKIVKSAPTYIKVTKTPINGELIVKKLGKDVVVQEGDIVETSMLKDFTYYQGGKVCTAKDLGRCTDAFSYIPYGEWVGTGEYQKTNIKINTRQSETLLANNQELPEFAT